MAASAGKDEDSAETWHMRAGWVRPGTAEGMRSLEREAGEGLRFLSP